MIGGETMLTATESLRLAGVGPCLFAAAYVWWSDRGWKMLLLPSLYFLWLAASFTLPLALRLELVDASAWRWVRFAVDAALPALNFLIIVQFVRASPPSLGYIAVLALPLLGGSTLFTASVIDAGSCKVDDACAQVAAVRGLFSVFGVALLYLLLIVMLPRLRAERAQGYESRRLRYWLVLALIAFDLTRAAISLGAIAGAVTPGSATLAEVIIQLAFVYLASTLVFRIYGDDAAIAPTVQPERIRDDETQLAAKIEAYLAETRPYLEMGFNRAALARAVGTNETQLSRVINTHFGESFTTLANRYRVEAAKERLREETTPVTTIAFETGFNSIASFNRVFKQMTGVAPTAYRAGSDGEGETEALPLPPLAASAP